MKQIVRLLLTFILFGVVGAHAETVILHSENGQGGIRKTSAQLSIVDGQYVVNFPQQSYNGSVTFQQIPVKRIKDSAKLMYNQKKWAEEYEYAIEISSGFMRTTPYYFNMMSQWIPSPVDDPNDPYRITPIKKINVYIDYGSGPEASKMLLILYQGKNYIYWGDDFFVGIVESNARPDDFAPGWSRQFKFRAKTSGGWQSYFNI